MRIQGLPLQRLLLRQLAHGRMHTGEHLPTGRTRFLTDFVHSRSINFK